MSLRITVITAVFLFGFNHAAHAFTQPKHQTLLLQQQYLKEINQCATPSSFSRLVDKALRSPNPELTAKFAMSIEEMIVQNPACFVEASIKIGKSKCQKLEAMFIQEPHFYPRENLKQSLSSTHLYSQSCFAG